MFVGNRGPLCNRDNTRSSLYSSIVTFRVLKWRRQEGQRTGSLLKLTQLKARHRCHNKNRMKEMKYGPHSLQPTKGTLQN